MHSIIFMPINALCALLEYKVNFNDKACQAVTTTTIYLCLYHCMYSQ